MAVVVAVAVVAGERHGVVLLDCEIEPLHTHLAWSA